MEEQSGRNIRRRSRPHAEIGHYLLVDKEHEPIRLGKLHF